MSEHENPNEPLIIKSDRPHEVTLPEGTNMAVGKKGEEGTPSVRKVLADPDEHAVEHMVMDGGVSKSADQHHSVFAQDPNYKGYQSAAELPDHFVSSPTDSSIPAPVKKTIDISKLDSILKPQENPVRVDTPSTTPVDSPAPAVDQSLSLGAMPEMDFPARVINLKIENDKLRSRLDDLE
ncbi:MAG: hypothetical protein ACKOD8_01380 [Limnohabitans sp.]